MILFHRVSQGMNPEMGIVKNTMVINMDWQFINIKIKYELLISFDITEHSTFFRYKNSFINGLKLVIYLMENTHTFTSTR